MRTFKIERNPYYDEQQIFDKKEISFDPGVTVLVGCNGAGKTTMMHMMQHQLDREKIQYMSFNNLTDGGNNAMQLALDSNRIAMLATQATSSEGENILINLGYNAGKIGRKLSENPDIKEFWLFFDAVDSGLSIDNIVDLKQYLFNIILKDPANDGKDIYIIITANSFEMAKDYPCVAVQECERKNFNTYEEYKEFILNSKKKKAKREE